MGGAFKPQDITSGPASEASARESRIFKVSIEEPGSLTPKEFNDESAMLADQARIINQKLLDAGRGFEKPSETLKKDDPLSREFKAVADRQHRLREESKLRMGDYYSYLPSHAGKRIK